MLRLIGMWKIYKQNTYYKEYKFMCQLKFPLPFWSIISFTEFGSFIDFNFKFVWKLCPPKILPSFIVNVFIMLGNFIMSGNGLEIARPKA